MVPGTVITVTKVTKIITRASDFGTILNNFIECHAKVPIILVVGEREATESTVAMRRLGGKQQEVLALGEALARLANEARSPVET